jgi:hypothetical protein
MRSRAPEAVRAALTTKLAQLAIDAEFLTDCCQCT